MNLVPFSTALLARFPTLRISPVEYWLSPELARQFRGRILIAQSLYAFATALSLIFPTWVSITLIVLVQLNYMLAPRIPILHRF